MNRVAAVVEDGGLARRLQRLSEHVAALVAARRDKDNDPDNPYRGLYVSDAEAQRLALERGERAFESFDGSFSDHRGGDVQSDSRLAVLARNFVLDALDLDILTVALAPDLEPRFEKLYGYLHDDLTRRRASVGLALELCGMAFADGGGRARFDGASRLVKSGLLLVEDPARPTLTRPLRVPDRVSQFLLGVPASEPVLDSLEVPSVLIDHMYTNVLSQALKTGTIIHVQDGLSGIGLSLGASAMCELVGGSLSIELCALSTYEDAEQLVRASQREAALTGRGLVVRVDLEFCEGAPSAMLALADTEWPTVVMSPGPWNPQWSPRPVFSVVAPTDNGEVSAALWRRELPMLPAGELHEATRQFRLRPDQIVRASSLASATAAASLGELDVEMASAAARSQNSARLEKLSRRIRPQVSFDDLVVPPLIAAQLSDIETRYRQRDTVHGVWGLGGANNRRLGVVALFAGPSGVGKTMGAEALAHSLGLDMYQVNLATVVDKYIGETEKNLERIFSAAEGVNGVILFDEADALFGKRSDVSDAKDRYANVEVAYLLQRLETYEGVAVLATNLRTNIDDAFTRRLDAVIDFPEPDEEHRRILWNRSLGRVLARGDDVDLDFLARRFRLAGGNIRNIAVAAAFFAVARDHVVCMDDLVLATAREYQKLGRLCTQAEFGPWFDRIS